MKKEDEKIKKTGSSPKEYGAKSIKILEGLEAVRKRPAMYIGSTDIGGLHHLVYEVVDNSVDEALAGHCNKIKVILHSDGSCSVEDNGRGIPVDIHPTEKVSATQVVLTKLHAGGKFEKDSYKYSGGLHGVGVSVVNALSENLKIKVYRNSRVYEQEYKRGKPVAPLKEIGESDKKGTYIRFTPDTKIFDVTEFKFETLASRLRELAFLNKNLKIKIVNENTEQEEVFLFEGGIVSFVEAINTKKNPIFKEVIQFNKDDDKYVVDLACQYNDGYSEQVFSFVNNIRTVEGGTHEAGLRSALTKSCNKAAQSLKILKEGESFSSDDVREGIVCVLSIKVPEPQFEGQTKTKLGNSEVKGLVDSWLYAFLNTYFEEHPQIAKKILQKAQLAQQARNAAKRARELTRRKTVLESSILPGKLADCSETDAAKTELFIVEGDSAGGCFSGETKIALLDGRNLSFKDLIEEDKQGIQNYCYTTTKEGNVDIAPIKNPRKTKINTNVIKVTLDNNEEITCTPDHLFMLKDGSYKKAQDLTQNDSLMPLYRKLSKIEKRITINGYEMVLDSKKQKWIFTHLLSDKFNLKYKKYSIEDGSHKHHVNFNKLNNNPENILRMHKDDHLELHRQMLEFTIHREDVKEKAKKAHQTKEYKEKVSAIMSTPKMKEMLSKRAKKQWEDENYKNYMIEKFLAFYENNEDYRTKNNKQLNENQIKHWGNPENRKKQSERTKEFFKQNPQQKELLSESAKQQWENKDLLAWRSEKTKEQWTDAFRNNRKNAYNKTYYENTIKVLKNLYEKDKCLKEYDTERKKLKNPNLLKYDTFCSRFFNGDESKLKDAVKLYNHKIKKIIKLDQKIDVYDLEVEDTYNFALSSGVFVHNSAKQGRDRFTQAILPLRGKVINAEKARFDKLLANNEIKDLVTAIGAGIGETGFDASKVRYHKIIIMTDADVDGSHIRILLLTFFFRHMGPLIDNGYLYAAQPPLYKAKVGRAEKYLKDDSELNQFLFEWAEKNTHLKINKKTYKDDDWKKTLDQILKYEQEIGKISNYIEVSKTHCHELIGFLDKSNWQLEKYTPNEIVEKLQKDYPKYKITCKFQTDQEDENALETVKQAKEVIIFKENKKTWEVPLTFFESEETTKLLSLYQPLKMLDEQSWIFVLSEKTEKSGTGVLNFANAIIKAGKSLMTIQRYKGLGEMNYDQLWETTMNPATRSLLKVTVEDAIKADQWFTSLMGDVVEDRREYIEKHAHFVKNLDI